MKKAIFLPFIMIFLSCQISLADVITLNEGSVFEGEVVEKDKGWTVFRVADGTFGIGDRDIVSIEDRKPTADEKARLIRFKTERYDATYESDFVTPFEEDVMRLYVFGCYKKLSEKTCVEILAEKFNLPPIIVWWILEFKTVEFAPLVFPTGDEEEFFGVQ